MKFHELSVLQSTRLIEKTSYGAVVCFIEVDKGKKKTQFDVGRTRFSFFGEIVRGRNDGRLSDDPVFNYAVRASFCIGFDGLVAIVSHAGRREDLRVQIRENRFTVPTHYCHESRDSLFRSR